MHALGSADAGSWTRSSAGTPRRPTSTPWLGRTAPRPGGTASGARRPRIPAPRRPAGRAPGPGRRGQPGAVRSVPLPFLLLHGTADVLVPPQASGRPRRGPLGPARRRGPARGIEVRFGTQARPLEIVPEARSTGRDDAGGSTLTALGAVPGLRRVRGRPCARGRLSPARPILAGRAPGEHRGRAADGAAGRGALWHMYGSSAGSRSARGSSRPSHRRRGPGHRDAAGRRLHGHRVELLHRLRVRPRAARREPGRGRADRRGFGHLAFGRWPAWTRPTARLVGLGARDRLIGTAALS